MDVNALLKSYIVREVESQSSTSTNGIHWVRYEVKDRSYEGKTLFNTLESGNIAKVTYINATEIDCKTTFSPWFYEKYCTGGGESAGKEESSKSSGLFGSRLGSQSEESVSEPEHEPQPISAEERELVLMPFCTEGTAAEQLNWLVAHYVRVKSIHAEVSDEISAIEKKLSLTEDRIDNLTIPTDVPELFELNMAAAKHIDDNHLFNHIPGRHVKKVRDHIGDVLKLSSMTHNQQLHEMADRMLEDKLFKTTPIYKKVMEEKIEDASARGSVDDLKFLAGIFNEFTSVTGAIKKMHLSDDRAELLAVGKALIGYMEESAKFGSVKNAQLFNSAPESTDVFSGMTKSMDMMKESTRQYSMNNINTLKAGAENIARGKMEVTPQTNDVTYHDKLLELLDKADRLFPGDADFVALRAKVTAADEKKKKMNKMLIIGGVVLFVVVVIVGLIAS